MISICAPPTFAAAAIFVAALDFGAALHIALIQPKLSSSKVADGKAWPRDRRRGTKELCHDRFSLVLS
jgi:hypothetical protein